MEDNKRIVIKGKDDTIKLSVPVTSKCVYRKTKMEEEYVLLDFNSNVLIPFEKGDYIVTDYGRFSIVYIDKPKISPKGGYVYSQRFHPDWERLRNRMLFYDRQNGAEKAWKMTNRPEYFLDIIISNIKSAGLGDYSFVMDKSLTEMKALEFDATYIIDGLNIMSEAWGTEWWFADNVLHFEKCQFGDPVTLKMYDAVADMQPDSGQDSEYFTRLYAFGSTRNLSKNYRKGESGVVVEGVVETRLKLPKGIDYVDAWPNMADEDIVEGIALFDDVYPQRTGTITAEPTTKEYVDEIENEDGTTTEEKWNAFRYVDGGLMFSKKYVIEGEELHIIFQSGKLAGMDFAVTFNPDAVADETKSEAQVWEIVRNEDYGMPLPSDDYAPAKGDTYILYGYDTKFVADQLETVAELELYKRALAKVAETSIDKSVYTCKTNPIRCAGYVKNEEGKTVFDADKTIDLDVGQSVTLINKDYFGEGNRPSRIYSFEKRLDNKYIATYTVGDTAVYSSRKELNEKIDEVAHQSKQLGSSYGSSVYVIKLSDSTAPTDHNVYSAKRSDKQFARKDRSDTFQGQMTFKERSINEAGVQFGDTFIPGLLGIGGAIDGKGNAELRSLKLWEWLEVPELRYNRVSINIGLQMNTCGGGIIETVTPDSDFETGHIALKLEGGEYGAVKVDDFCMGIWHDTEGGNAEENTDDRKGTFSFRGFKTVYFQITDIPAKDNEGNDNSDQHYFAYVLRSKEQGGNGIHPYTGMHFATRGNASDEERQSFSYYSPIETYALAVTGANAWELTSSNYYEIRGKLDGFTMPAVNEQGEPYTKVFHGYGQVFGNAYIFGQIDQFERVAYRCQIYQSLGGMLAPNETEDVSVQVFNGYGEDVTSRFTLISVERNTGDEASDALWNAQHTNVGNPFQIAFSDLGIDGIHKVVAVFHVTATDEATDAQTISTIEFTS